LLRFGGRHRRLLAAGWRRRRSHPRAARVVKSTGDGAIIEFRSVVDAVRCAIEVQSGMAERNAGLPEDRRIEFRIGIHLGDIVEESDGDLMGDGVNIAARLEGVAEPGGICLSDQEDGRSDCRTPIAAIRDPPASELPPALHIDDGEAASTPTIADAVHVG
jgi:class 3 adenylate cyclase